MHFLAKTGRYAEFIKLYKDLYSPSKLQLLAKPASLKYSCSDLAPTLHIQ